MIKEIDLKALNSFGIAKAYVDENSVGVKVYGVSGCLKAWLTGEKTIEIGNLVNGSITKEIKTAPFDGVLVTQSGRQMFYGKFKNTSNKEKDGTGCTLPLDDGYSWQEITSKKFPSDNLSVRYILSHKCFYNAFLLHGKYYYGTKGDCIAIAIECNIKSEPHPFLHLSAYATYKNGYMIVCTDTKSKTFITYE